MSDFPPRVPQELLDKIIDDLQDDLGTLKHCSLTSRCLHLRSQIHLFSTIRILNSNQCRRLRDVMDANKMLSEYVHDLSITDIDNWIEEDIHLPYILRMTTSLHALCLQSSASEGVNWDSLPEDTQNAFARALLYPSLVDLKIDGINWLPVTFLGFSMNLKNLTLRDISVDSIFRNPTSTESIDFSRLTALAVEFAFTQPDILDRESLVDVITNPHSFISRIRKLRLHNHCQTMSLAVPIMNCATQSLETIELCEWNHDRRGDIDAASWYAYDFTTMANIQCLKLQFGLPFKNKTQFHSILVDTMRKLTEFFEGNASLSKIKRFNIRFIPYCHFDQPRAPSWSLLWEVFGQALLWRELDRVLGSFNDGNLRGSGSSGFRVCIELALRKVNEHDDVKVPLGAGFNRRTWHEAIAERMPLALERGVLMTDVILDIVI